MNEVILSAESIGKHYGKGDGQVIALNGVTAEFQMGKLYGIAGNSGSGKSTLLRVLSSLEEPSEGNVFYNGQNIYEMNKSDQACLRGREFGFVFQAYNLIPELTVYDNIAMPRYFIHKDITPEEVNVLAEKLGIGEKLTKHPDELSGGQQQRVAIARALINQPRVLFADEPTGNLDEANRIRVYKDLREYVDLHKKMVIVVSHDRTLFDYADMCYTMKDGVLHP